MIWSSAAECLNRGKLRAAEEAHKKGRRMSETKKRPVQKNAPERKNGPVKQTGPVKKDGFRKEFRKDFRKDAPPRRNGPGPRRDAAPAPKSKPEEPGMPARRIALKVIRQVTEQGAYASLALDKALEDCGLIAADRRLASRLAYDTLDHMIWLDYVLAQVMAREDTDIKLRNILRLGACQIMLEDRIPDSAATDTSVRLCVEAGMEGLKGVCNGILRNLIRKKDELVFPDPALEPDRAEAIRYSMPEWLWKKLKDAYGAETAAGIVTHRESAECWTVRPNLTKVTDAEFEKILEKKVWEKEKADVPHAWKVRGAMNIGKDADFLNGSFSIMTPGSMMACLAMDVKRGKQILDCCAAPGGKTCYLAEIMAGTGRVQAWDIHEHRTALIEAQAKRLGLENVRPMVRDAAKRREDLAGTMDGVLLDAPCSGTGMIAEKPDIKLRITEDSLQEMKEIQRRLLDTVCEYVKPGGTFVYSTCSVLPEENEEQAEAFLQRHPEFEACSLPETIPSTYREHQKTGLQLLPSQDGVEGFYLCRMKRKYTD